MSYSQTAFVETDTLRIAYERRGEGTPLLPLYDWPDSVRTWDDVTDALTAEGYATLAPSLRGYGETTFLLTATLRSGQVVAFAQDVIDIWYSA